MFRSGKWLVILTLVCSLALADETETQLQQLTELLSTGEDIGGFQHSIQAKAMVADFYRLRQYKPAWSDRKIAGDILQTLAESAKEGLLPDDYHYSELLGLYNNEEGKAQSPSYQQSEFELLMTDGILLYAVHLVLGKLDPAHLDQTWNYKRRQPLPKEIIANLERHAQNGTVVSALNALKPNLTLYKTMKEGLVFYKQLAKTYPFVVIDETPLLELGAQSSAVPKLRSRLIELQFLNSTEANSDIYDEDLVKAVKIFQENHAMDADGVIGNQTWQALNMSWQQRIDKLRVNLERTRWVHENVTDNFVLVNIAGFTLYVVRDKQVVWKTEVMTGTVKNETPLFTSRFSYMELNPTWTIPRSILKNSLINKIKANPHYLEERDFVLYDRKGKAVNTDTLDFSTLSVNNFPYNVVQQPGDKNALGQVKFIFPNDHSIYLHDTPSKSLFSRSARAFSHGCVRVKNPLEFARVLMNDPEKWTADKIEEIVTSKKRTRVTIKKPTDLMLMYWTTEPSDTAKIKFNPDIYNRDARILSALNESS